ncbi:S8 family serine peptidase [Microbulbifer sp. SA54]|uniref:S8 family serine peptidase n=1 Tax=Microbulbifer sp. SA54 TaxID=3401577 RepID=UPI003AAB1887
MRKPLPKLLAGALALAISAQASAADDRYIVKFKEGKGPAVKALMERNGGRSALALEKQNAMAAHLSDKALSALRSNPNVEYVEQDVKRYLMAETEPYGISMVQAHLVDDGAASNQTVCIIDSGYDQRHVDLAANLVTGSNDPGGTGSWDTDENSHGTHVAGTIAALENGEGVIGVLPGGKIKLHIVKVFGADGWAYSSSLVAAAQECANNGASVINMSLGGTFKSRTEDQAFADLYANQNILSVAAAGNDGNTRHSYPASYDSVISVAAVDSSKVVAGFSQQTDQVELAGPGVGVLSSVPIGMGLSSTVSVAGNAIEAAGMDGSPMGSASGALVNCGLGEATCADASGKVCLIERGNITFAEKVQACEAGGGVAAVIYNNEPGMLYGTMGDTITGIPSAGITDTDGAALLGQIGANSTLTIEASDYAYFDGTSMATPHVAGVAALVWSQFPSCTAAEIRTALNTSAEDLGAAGRDTAYGYGLVQAQGAVSFLTANPCGGGGSSSGGSSGGGSGGGKPCKGKNCTL